MGKPFKVDGPRELLLEGTTDCHVIAALCGAHKVPDTFKLYNCENDAGVIKRLDALLRATDMKERIGVVIDADAPNLISRWQSIRDKLSWTTYSFPEKPDPQGTIISTEGFPILGFWFMPDNQTDGMLEDFCASLAEPESMAAAKRAVALAEKERVTRFKEVHRTKAEVHTYLAWQDEPGRPPGQAITAQALRPHTPLAKQFATWLVNLFA